ncbi:hypothetical protein CONCODRAFT_7585 [Conidiobolus coronatus NRRL 28638]|uniref:Arrestin-like N-terminal domain-containing protein n=1 Tax=Conidiobolus coronatus (strain ATCC 28846 / CBS 209.66 / NRRL 28638) TaxID=796925 RepID=A0A137P4J2_CONC2|nr:hypothetical protein CONCODRAFT_7585 [Conidiobolus coronatus NRRL 28638]|eukprot:KXN69937.1 hypothetical protein CONCODRAFT_7585 [Conidiobolus coronatus NRRL 28638]
MFLSKPKYSVNIKVDNDEVFLNGSASEAQNTKLSGVVEVISSPESCPSSPVTIHFSLNCNLKVKSKDLFSSSHNQVLFRLNWTFKCHFDFSQASNTSKFPFTAKLPGDLPASVDLDDFKITYQFKAYEELPLIQTKTTLAAKQISIHRLTHDPRSQYALVHANNPVSIVKTKGEMNYQGLYTLNYPKIWYDLEKPMPIELKLNLLPSHRVHSVIYSIKQALNLNSIQRSEIASKTNYNYQLSTQNAYAMPNPKSKHGNTTVSSDYKDSICESGYIRFKLKTEMLPYLPNQKK